MISEELKYLIDFALGDGHIGKYDRSYHYKLEHSTKQEKYFRHKVELLKSLGFTGWERMNEKVVKGKTYHTISFCLHVNKHVKTAYKYLINKGRKAIDKKLLSVCDERTLAYWFMDDGGANKSHKSSSSPGNGYRYYYTYPEPKIQCFSLYTYAFTLDEQNLIKSWIKNRFDIEARLINSKIGYYLKISKNIENKKKFINLVRPYIIPSMQYKIDGRLSYKGINYIECKKKKL